MDTATAARSCCTAAPTTSARGRHEMLDLGQRREVGFGQGMDRGRGSRSRSRGDEHRIVAEGGGVHLQGAHGGRGVGRTRCTHGIRRESRQTPRASLQQRGRICPGQVTKGGRWNPPVRVVESVGEERVPQRRLACKPT